LLMGELQQKYQSRLVAHTRTDSDNIHTKFLLETYKTELNSKWCRNVVHSVLLQTIDDHNNSCLSTCFGKTCEFIMFWLLLWYIINITIKCACVCLGIPVTFLSTHLWIHPHILQSQFIFCCLSVYFVGVW